jgi:FtsZ-interacting cell division protein YlmF
VFAKIGSWFAIRDEELDDLDGYDVDQPAPKRNVVPLTEAGRRAGPSVAVFAPRGFSDVTEIADALRSRQVAIVNLQGADRTLLQRVVDFTSGVNSANLREQMADDGMLDLSARFGNTARNER